MFYTKPVKSNSFNEKLQPDNELESVKRNVKEEKKKRQKRKDKSMIKLAYLYTWAV